MSETMFDFLQDQVAHIQDLQGDEEPAMSSGLVPDAETTSKVTRKRYTSSVSLTICSSVIDQSSLYLYSY